MEDTGGDGNVNRGEGEGEPARESIAYLRLQNAQLWKIIEKQRVIIDGLKDQLGQLGVSFVPADNSNSNSNSNSNNSLGQSRVVVSDPAGVNILQYADPSSNSSNNKKNTSNNTNTFSNTSTSSSFDLTSTSAVKHSVNKHASDIELKSALAIQLSQNSIASSTTSDNSNSDLAQVSTSPLIQSALDAKTTPYTSLSLPRSSISSIAFAGFPPRSSSVRGASPLPDLLYDHSTPTPESPKSNILLNNGPLLLADSVTVRVVASLFQDSTVEGTLFFIAVKKVVATSGDGGVATAGGTENEEWKIEKRYSDFQQLDQKLRSKIVGKSILHKLPDKHLFTSTNPAKSQQRKNGLELYLLHALDIADTFGVKEILYTFLTTNISVAVASSSTSIHGSLSLLATGRNYSESGDIDSLIGSGLEMAVFKEGYLMKRGKHLGGWKPRYFKCKPYFLDYSDGPQKQTQTTISLKHCHVLSINPTASDTKSAHGLVIIEFHKEYYPVPFELTTFPENKVHHRHILAADNDQDRDEWVSVISTQIKEARALEPIVEKQVAHQHHRPGSILGKQISVPHSITTIATTISAPRDSSSSGLTTPTGENGGIGIGRSSTSRRLSQVMDDPTSSLRTSKSFHKQSSRKTTTTAATDNSTSAISFSSRGAPPVVTIGLIKSPESAPVIPIKNSIDDNERVMMQTARPLPQLLGHLQHLNVSPGMLLGSTGTTPPSAHGLEKHKSFVALIHRGMKKKTADTARLVFGAPLEQALSISRISNDIELPAVVYRCIEYLDCNKAAQEEGIYRLSGTTTAIQQLKNLFNSDSDVDLLNDTITNIDMVDVHAVAGLLKLYLRDLPAPILTVALQKEFVDIAKLDDRNDRVIELCRLTKKLPKPNYTLLATIMSHLIQIAQASHVNKMTARNLCIVFSPTLNIPVLVLTLMLAEFDHVFCWNSDSDDDCYENGGGEGERRQKRKSVNLRIKEMTDRKETER
ncbi:hypothetical protein HK100_006709 [Physocladia obscura]|uniref:RhoGAP-domain-containing protein n=1 Tax=Physocladia obscura TaxID=109957 RepID=A0AAD5TAZ8_9FUNG|nr:hypothetical protein HK100_006709 [Physocladia obscura]